MRIAPLTSGARHAAHARTSRGGAEHRGLAVLMRERPGHERACKPAGNFVAQDERAQHVFARASCVLGRGEDAGKDLHCGLARDEPQALAQLDRAPGDPVEQRRRARIGSGAARRIHRGARAAGGRQALPKRLDFRSSGARENDPDRVEQDELCMLSHALRDFLPVGIRDEAREFFQLSAHDAVTRVGYRPA